MKTTKKQQQQQNILINVITIKGEASELLLIAKEERNEAKEKETYGKP